MPHLGSNTVRRAVSALALVAFAALAGAWGLGGARQAGAGGSLVTMSIDVDISGNTPTSTLTSAAPIPHTEVLGQRDQCARVEPNGLQDFDEDAVDVLGVDLTIQGVNPPDFAFPLPVVVADGGDGINSLQTQIGVNDTDIDKPPMSIVFPGDSIRVGSERMGVTAVNHSTHTLTVTRGIGGTNAAAHAEGAAVMETSGMFAFGVSLTYDDATFTIESHNPQIMLNSLVGSSVFDAGISTTPGAVSLAAADVGLPSSAEFGSGVFDRVSVTVNQAAASGVYDLTLTSAAWIKLEGTASVPDVVNNATISVGQPCPVAFGDVDCSGGVSAVDALKVLRFNAGLSVAQNDPCVDLGLALPNTELQGDVDCSNTVSSVDALKLLRYGAGLSVAQNDPCPDVGT